MCSTSNNFSINPPFQNIVFIKRGAKLLKLIFVETKTFKIRLKIHHLKFFRQGNRFLKFIRLGHKLLGWGTDNPDLSPRAFQR